MATTIAPASWTRNVRYFLTTEGWTEITAPVRGDIEALLSQIETGSRRASKLTRRTRQVEDLMVTKAQKAPKIIDPFYFAA